MKFISDVARCFKKKFAYSDTLRYTYGLLITEKKVLLVPHKPLGLIG